MERIGSETTIAALEKSGLYLEDTDPLAFFAKNILLDPGPNSLKITAERGDGASSVSTFTVDVDTQKPTVAFSFNPTAAIVGYRSLYHGLLVDGALESHANYVIGGSIQDNVGVDLDTMSQIEGHLRMHHHEGLTKRGRVRGRNL